jgi:hypothetical protein
MLPRWTPRHCCPVGLGAPATRALGSAGYDCVGDLRGVGKQRLLSLHGVGPKAIRVLEAALAERGWSLSPEG